MSGAHGGYTEHELIAIAGGEQSQDVRTRMQDFAKTISGESQESIPFDSDASAKQELPKDIPPAPKEKRLKATPTKLKKVLGDIPARILESRGIELDEEDRDAMEESAEFLANVFGVEFSIPESKFMVKSRFAAIVWVMGVMLLVWLKHKTPEVWGKISKDIVEEKKSDEKPKENNN